MTRFSDVVMRIMRSPAVYIAAVNGPCGGGGIEMSVCFDVRIASETAGFAIPELLIGLTTTVGGQRLSRLVGLGKALEMTLEGRMYSAREALDMGLVSQVVPPEQLVETAKKLAARYATRNRLNIGAQKRLFNEDALRSPSVALLRERCEVVPRAAIHRIRGQGFAVALHGEFRFTARSQLVTQPHQGPRALFSVPCLAEEASRLLYSNFSRCTRST